VAQHADGRPVRDLRRALRRRRGAGSKVVPLIPGVTELRPAKRDSSGTARSYLVRRRRGVRDRKHDRDFSAVFAG